MARLQTSRIIPIALILIIVAIAIAALVSLARVVFFSGSSTSTAKVDTSQAALLSTDADRSVTMTVRGPIVADESFHSYTISIAPGNRSLTTYTGYQDTIVNQVNLPNSVPGYSQFVHALDKANLAKGTAFTGDSDSTLGICATGNVYEFSIIQSETVIKHLWTSTCGGSKGSLNASVAQLSNLFVTQIPNASQFISKIDL
jgi:hypothetical protein